jgi:hypothetical protein
MFKRAFEWATRGARGPAVFELVEEVQRGHAPLSGSLSLTFSFISYRMVEIKNYRKIQRLLFVLTVSCLIKFSCNKVTIISTECSIL